jgi:hypothetical protein
LPFGRNCYRLFNFFDPGSEVELLVRPTLDDERQLLYDDSTRIGRKSDQSRIAAGSLTQKCLLVSELK